MVQFLTGREFFFFLKAFILDLATYSTGNQGSFPEGTVAEA
jgi:hypothetical protein